MIWGFALSHDVCIARTREGPQLNPRTIDQITFARAHGVMPLGSIVQPFRLPDNLLAPLFVCSKVNQGEPCRELFKHVRFSFRQILPPSYARMILQSHTLLRLSEAQRASITHITLETFQFISMVDNWRRPIAWDTSGLREFLELLPGLKRVEIIGYQRGFHRREMDRRAVYTRSDIDESTLDTTFESVIQSSKPDVTITRRVVDRLNPSYVDGHWNDWLGTSP